MDALRPASALVTVAAESRARCATSRAVQPRRRRSSSNAEPIVDANLAARAAAGDGGGDADPGDITRSLNKVPLHHGFAGPSIQHAPGRRAISSVAKRPPGLCRPSIGGGQPRRSVVSRNLFNDRVEPPRWRCVARTVQPSSSFTVSGMVEYPSPSRGLPMSIRLTLVGTIRNGLKQEAFIDMARRATRYSNDDA